MAKTPRKKVFRVQRSDDAKGFSSAVYLVQTKDNIAIALSQLVDNGWLSLEAAVDVAKSWLFDNPSLMLLDRPGK